MGKQWHSDDDRDSFEDLNESEFPDESDQDDDDSVDTEACPYCGKQIHDQADICPHCGSFVAWDDEPRRRPLWIIIGMCLLVAILCLYLFGWAIGW